MLRENRKRIVLIEDHMLVRQGLERLLNTGDEFVVCEEASNAPDGIEIVREVRPDAVIVDIELPGPEDGIELTRTLLSEFPRLIVIVLSAHDQAQYAARAMAAGAMAYVRKSDEIDTLRAILRNAFSGKRTFADEGLQQAG